MFSPLWLLWQVSWNWKTHAWNEHLWLGIFLWVCVRVCGCVGGWVCGCVHAQVYMVYVCDQKNLGKRSQKLLFFPWYHVKNEPAHHTCGSWGKINQSHHQSKQQYLCSSGNNRWNLAPFSPPSLHLACWLLLYLGYSPHRVPAVFSQGFSCAPSSSWSPPPGSLLED